MKLRDHLNKKGLRGAKMSPLSFFLEKMRFQRGTEVREKIV